MTDQQLSPHFKLSEFLVHETTLPTPDILANLKELATALETVRESLGNKPITIISGYRSLAHNKSVGGVQASTHLQGLGADIDVEGLSPREVYKIFDPTWKGGLGLYPAHIHIDVRPYKARWKGKDS